MCHSFSLRFLNYYNSLSKRGCRFCGTSCPLCLELSCSLSSPFPGPSTERDGGWPYSWYQPWDSCSSTPSCPTRSYASSSTLCLSSTSWRPLPLLTCMLGSCIKPESRSPLECIGKGQRSSGEKALNTWIV